jgi:hypothetical protein
MSMKKTLTTSVLAVALSTAAVSGAYAATVSKATNAPKATTAAKTIAPKIAIIKASFSINGETISIRTIKAEGATLVAVRDLANLLGAAISSEGGKIYLGLDDVQVELALKSKQIVVNGNKVALGHAVQSVNGSLFIEAQPVVEAFRATYTADGGSVSIETIQLLEGIEEARWINADWMLTSKLNDNGRADYLVNAKTGEYQELLVSSDTSDLIVSPDGKNAAYADASGIVNVINLSTKQSKAVSADSSIKNELQWSADGSSLYFLQGDKGSVIAKLNVADGSVTKVLDDKVDYKTNLRPSGSGSQFIYTVSKIGKVTADDKKDVDLDDVAIDLNGTEPQIFYFDAAAKDAKAVQLTTSKDDKVFLELTADGSKAFYVNASDDAAILSGLMFVTSGSKQAASVFNEQDVYQAVASGGKIYVLASGKGTVNGIYEIDQASGAKKLLYTVPGSVSEIIVNGSSVAIIDGGVLKVEQSGKWKALSR